MLKTVQDEKQPHCFHSESNNNFCQDGNYRGETVQCFKSENRVGEGMQHSQTENCKDKALKSLGSFFSVISCSLVFLIV